MVLLWTEIHLWTSGARFSFNVYSHYKTLIVTARDSTNESIISCEVIIQGCPFSMVVSGLGIFPLIHQLQEVFQGIHKTWCVDDDSTIRWFS